MTGVRDQQSTRAAEWAVVRGPRSRRSTLLAGGQNGFTLLELLLALSIFTIMASGLYGVLKAGMDVQRVGEEVTRTMQIARVALDRLARDLRCAYVSTGTFGSAENLNGEFFVGTDESDGEYDTDTLCFFSVCRLPQQNVREDSPDEWIGGVCDIVEMEYRVSRDEADDVSGLVEAVRQIVQIEDEEPTETEIAPEVVSLNFRYHDGDDWQDSWDSSTDKQLPRAVEISIGIEPGEKSRDNEIRYFTTVVALPTAGAVTPEDLTETVAE